MRKFIGRGDFTWFVGVVEDRNDPVKLGRVRVRAFGWHTDQLDKIPTESLPWAIPMNGINSASVSGIGDSPTGMVEGTWIIGFFMDGERAQEPVVMGTIASIPADKADPSKGFNDPFGVYPREVDEPDCNRRTDATREKEHTITIPKSDAAEVFVPKANGLGDWDELDIEHASVYPKNHVYESESGHIREYDDTVGSERTLEYHKAGTFTEIDATGNKSVRVVGDNYEVVHKDDNVYIKGNCNITIDANATTYVKGNWDIQVDGNLTTNIKGDEFRHINGLRTSIIDGNENRTSGTHIEDNAPRIDHN